MREATDLQRSDRLFAQRVERSRQPRAEPVRFDLNAAVAEFLKGAVVEQLSRQRADHSGSLQIAPTATPAATAAESIAKVPAAPRASAEIIPLDSRLPIWKRGLDLTIVLLAWPIWFPVMILISLMIKLTSAGPVFYRQERVGYRGSRFMIFKFRTMKTNVDTRVHESHFERLIATDSPMTKLDAHGDPRLIKWGRFLRAAGLDELPQLFNVLRGEMSLVGARPCTVHEFDRYQPWQRQRVHTPPGLTGYWQVNGKNKTTFSEMIEMDIYYGRNMCVKLDLSIMARTVPAIVGQVLETRGLAVWWRNARRRSAPSLS
jgi:lipopolysaccharide/colanic/teichoic acid biosynthesis glycosyltransferase